MKIDNCKICNNDIYKHDSNQLKICNSLFSNYIEKHINYYNSQYLNDLENIKNNKYIKTNKIYKCDTCGKEIKNKRNYNIHINENICTKIKIKKIPEFKCNKCCKTFTDKRSLLYHNEHSVCNKNLLHNIQTPVSNTINNNTNTNTNNGINIQTQNIQTQNNQNIQTQNNQNNQNIININIGSTQDAEKIIEMIPFRTNGYKITPKKYLEYAKYPERAIKSFIKDEHFNPDKPERLNVLNSNYKSNKVSVLDYDEDDEIRWLLKSKNDINELLCDRVINHLFMAKIVLEGAGIKLDSEKEKKLNEEINNYENDEKVKKKYMDMISELSYNYRELVESNKRKQAKLIKN